MGKEKFPVLEAIACILMTGILVATSWIVAPGLKSEVTAAWVQAVGSIGAICAAIWIAQSTERQRKSHAYGGSEAFIRRSIDCIAEAWTDLASKVSARTSKVPAQFELRALELIEFSRRIDVSELDVDKQWLIYDMVGILHDTRVILSGKGTEYSERPLTDITNALKVHLQAARDIGNEYGLTDPEMQ